jgi:hypothetical protein
MLTIEEETFLRELLAEKKKQEQIDLLNKQMWAEVEPLKEAKDWEAVVNKKREFQAIIQELKDAKPALNA